MQSVGNRHLILYLLTGLGRVAHARGQLERAARLCGAAAALRDSMPSAIEPYQRSVYDLVLAGLPQALGADAFTLAWERGRALSWDETIAYALQDTGS